MTVYLKKYISYGQINTIGGKRMKFYIYYICGFWQKTFTWWRYAPLTVFPKFHVGKIWAPPWIKYGKMVIKTLFFIKNNKSYMEIFLLTSRIHILHSHSSLVALSMSFGTRSVNLLHGGVAIPVELYLWLVVEPLHI